MSQGHSCDLHEQESETAKHSDAPGRALESVFGDCFLSSANRRRPADLAMLAWSGNWGTSDMMTVLLLLLLSRMIGFQHKVQIPDGGIRADWHQVLAKCAWLDLLFDIEILPNAASPAWKR